MGQEFHVLRCFSCQIFQVQQVKKSKKWACKVCGEKQSLVKEFGRGGAADCRRHVQKLNALSGRLQEVSSQTPGSQRGEEDESEDEDDDEDLMSKSEQEVCHHVSRWSKYTDPTAEGPDEHEDEEEEQNIYTERQRFRSQGTRKRKKISTVKPFADPHDVSEDEESLTGCSGLKRPYLPLQHDRRFSSAWNEGSASCGRSGDVDPSSSIDLPSSRLAVCSSTYTAESPGNKQQHKPSAETSDSKWNKFLPVVSSQRDEEEYDHQAHDVSQYKNTVMPYFTEALVDCEEHRYPPDEQTSRGVCVEGRLSSTTNTHTSKPSGFEPPPLAKTPRSTLSFNPMFLTDEDFDDTF